MPSDHDPLQALQEVIAALELRREALGDSLVDAALAPLRQQLMAAAPLPAEPERRLRQVSVLFLDIVGSTQLIQHLEPEDVQSVVDGALAAFTDIVQRHGGEVLRYAGDNVKAAFGARGTREDDAERAVLCGLEMLQEAARRGEAVRRDHGRDGFGARVGIHTGSVVRGGGIEKEKSLSGLAVNIAARMEQTAPAGALRISQDTYAQVRGLFDVAAQEPVAVKGLDTPLPSYLVQRAKPRRFRIGTRGIEGVATRMIGRDAELHALQAAFARLFAERRLAAVTVVAEAGVGKSRLQVEFQAWSELQPERFHLFRGRATPQTAQQAYGLLRDMLAWRFQIHDDDSVDVARRKMEEAIVPLFQGDDGVDLAVARAHLLGHLIGIEWQDSRHLRGILEDARQIRNRAFHAAALLFRRLSAQDGSPVLLDLCDLHWADDESLDLLDHLADVNRDVPMLVMAFTRPTLFERRAAGAWIAEGVHQRIELRPLDAATSRRLAEELLQKLPDIPRGLAELLVDRAEGNPFHMEELLRMLIDRSAIRTGDTWAVDAGRLLTTQVPSTLTGVLQARLDGLPATERQALQQASVVGAVFWDQALAAVEAQAVQELPALVQRELTQARADAMLESLREYAFRHQLLHQVTYDTVLRPARREGHARVAQWLAELTESGGLRAGDLQGLAAEHFERAGDAARAAEFHARAAEHARRRFAHERVLAHVGRALALLDTMPSAAAGDGAGDAELRWRLLSARETTLGLQARRAEQLVDLDALAALAEALNDDPRRARAARRRSLRAMRMADWAAAEVAARQAMACATAAHDDEERLHALRMLAWVRVAQDDGASGRALAMQGLDEARALSLRVVEALLLNTLAMAASTQGDMEGYLDAQRQSLQIHRELGDRVNEAIGLSNLGIGWLNLGDLGQAERDLQTALELLKADGNRVIEGKTRCMLGVVALWQGHAVQALTLTLEAQHIASATKALDDEVLAALQVAAAELALGHTDAARATYARAHQQAVAIGHPLQHEASAGLARVALTAGDAAAALAALQPVLDPGAAATPLTSAVDERQIELTCHQALAHAGDPRADEWLVRAHTALMRQVGAITQRDVRQGFLHNNPHHREIVAAWARRGDPMPLGPLS
jgi:class 3 adenylate cyclase/tetratricopeptide (TPR) repeat protein